MFSKTHSFRGRILLNVVFVTYAVAESIYVKSVRRHVRQQPLENMYLYVLYDIFLSTAIRLTPGGSGTVHTTNT